MPIGSLRGRRCAQSVVGTLSVGALPSAGLWGLQCGNRPYGGVRTVPRVISGTFSQGLVALTWREALISVAGTVGRARRRHARSALHLKAQGHHKGSGCAREDPSSLPDRHSPGSGGGDMVVHRPPEWSSSLSV